MPQLLVVQAEAVALAGGGAAGAAGVGAGAGIAAGAEYIEDPPPQALKADINKAHAAAGNQRR